MDSAPILVDSAASLADTTVVLRPPVSTSEIEAVEPEVRKAILKAYRVLTEEGAVAFRLRYGADDGRTASVGDSVAEGDNATGASGEVSKTSGEAIIGGSPRQYQLSLLEHAKESNAIIHLGTGQGKTFIALMRIMDLAHELELGEDDDSGMARVESRPNHSKKQTWFLVPSVALAVQHTETIRANLPSLAVETACDTASNSAEARNNLAGADVMVATHGAALDLLNYYGDMFHLSRVNLLVFDECHYATGKHGYAQIMKNFYHRIDDVKERPRVLGLTASPLINVKKRVTNEQLSKQMAELEEMLDARVVSYASLDEEAEGDGLKAVRQDLEETIIPFSSGASSFQPLPGYEGLRLHKSRHKELNQLQCLCEDLGPKATGEYISAIVEELTQSRFEGESADEFDSLLCHLQNLSRFCLGQCTVENNGGRSNKLEVLEKTLDERFLEDSTREDHVGLIFVERRITVIALHHYLRLRQKEKGCSFIRCNMLVRQASQVFKYLNIAHKLCGADKAELERAADREWLHRVAQIQEVLDGLRRKDINLLIATSVVEEGVDVAACSFVIAFDNMKTTKGYVQMKGRARQKCAKFFCFRDENPNAPAAPVSLDEAKDVERKVELFLRHREKKLLPLVRPHSRIQNALAPSEEKALESGEYCTNVARVDLWSSKSLLNRYFMSIPLESTVRSSKESMALNMPIYDVGSWTLVLPAHLPTTVRYIELPPQHRGPRKKTTESQLALMACVRLHQLGLLNNRLLPLGREDMHDRLMKIALRRLPAALQMTAASQSSPFPPGIDSMCMSLHPLVQTGCMFDQHDEALGGNKRHLGVLSLQPLPEIKNFSLNQVELGRIDCSVGEGRSLVVSKTQWLLCIQFYATVINSRWRRRTSGTYFEYDETNSGDIVAPYAIVSLTADNELDWQRMETVAAEYRRTETEKTVFVRSAEVESMRMPRLWAPLYDPNVTYICYGPTAKRCSESFPDKDYNSYRDYMQRKRSFSVDADCRLCAVQHLWTLPRKMQRNEGIYTCTESELKRRKVLEESLGDGELAPCKGLKSALLPQSACMEAPLADASLYLHLVVLPQILYHIDRCLTARAFVVHSRQISNKLAKHLSSIDHDGILEALTASSCAMGDFSYDRLEYLGDAVLKVLHTDALLHSPDLKEWTHCLHEGDLSKLRSAMGSNERLKDAATRCGIDKFILTRPLSRGQWAPTCFILKADEAMQRTVEKEEENEEEKHKPSSKVIADVVEALLGLVYVHSGFAAAAEVAESLGVTLPHVKSQAVTPTAQQAYPVQMLQRAKLFLDIEKFRNPALLLEALTHASCIHQEVPSYQRLEWVGDAVLTLATREWAYKRYKKLKVGSLVVVESTIVCNETLSYIACRRKLQDIIRHADATLPHRIESFVCGFGLRDWGLWQADPPKVLADIVEALLGAAHTDAGFEAGQRAALHVVLPVLDAVASHLGPDTNAGISEGTEIMMNPRQTLAEMMNRQRVRTRTYREHEYAARFSSPAVWRRGGWSEATARGDDAVCRITCCDVQLLSLAEHSNNAARNRCSALVAAILARNPDLVGIVESIALKCRDRTD